MNDATAFLDRWADVGASLDRPDDEGWTALGESLSDRHTGPLRSYHGQRHILAVLDTMAMLDAVRGTDPALQLAAFFHDAIYDPTGDANEEQSAVLAETELDRLGVNATIIETTARLVRATDGHETDGSPEVSLFLDADLAILGSPPHVYDAYATAIRREYGHLADDVFRSGRASVLTTFLDRRRLFFTAAGRDRFETQARQNLAREIDQLRTT